MPGGAALCSIRLQTHRGFRQISLLQTEMSPSSTGRPTIVRSGAGYCKTVHDADRLAFVVDNTATSLIENGALLMSLTEAGGGTRLSSTRCAETVFGHAITSLWRLSEHRRSILYADITASIKVTGKVGVVTAFITMSGVKVRLTNNSAFTPEPDPPSSGRDRLGMDR